MLNASGGAAPVAPQARSTENVDSPADDNSGLPDTPGVGALQSVVHSPVAGGARLHSRIESEASHANIVFGSNGRVSSVVINGAAAGTPAESCVRAAFMPGNGRPVSEAEVRCRRRGSPLSRARDFALELGFARNPNRSSRLAFGLGARGVDLMPALDGVAPLAGTTRVGRSFIAERCGAADAEAVGAGPGGRAAP